APSWAVLPERVELVTQAKPWAAMAPPAPAAVLLVSVQLTMEAVAPASTRTPAPESVMALRKPCWTVRLRRVTVAVPATSRHRRALLPSMMEGADSEPSMVRERVIRGVADSMYTPGARWTVPP